MFRLERPPEVERFELVLFTLTTPHGTMCVPVVDGWIEMQMTMHFVPNMDGRRAFFAALADLCAALRGVRPGMRWYFLHKPPGLKLRFHVKMPDVSLLERLIGTVLDWHFPWAEAAAMGSLFDQAELLPWILRGDAENLLTRAADAHLAAVIENRRCDEDRWTDFLVRLLLEVGLDEWLAFEALSRLLRLRSITLVPDHPADAELLFDPSGILAQPLGPFSPGFTSSVALLQSINLLLNIWGLGPGLQAKLLDDAREIIRPSLNWATDV